MTPDPVPAWPEALTPLAARLDGVLRSSALPRRLGLRVRRWWPGGAELVLPADGPWRPDAPVASGIVGALADAALEVASNSHGRRCAAISLSGHAVAGPRTRPPLVATAEEAVRDDRTATYVITTRHDGEVVAVHTGVVARTAGWHLGEEAWPASWREAH